MNQSIISFSRTEINDRRKSKVFECLNKISVIHPDSAKLFFWDITNFIFIILNLTYVPIETVINTTFFDIYGAKW